MLFPLQLEDAPEQKVPEPAAVAGQLNTQAGEMQETHLKLLYALCRLEDMIYGDFVLLAFDR